MKPEIVTIRRHSPPPLERSGGPRPYAQGQALECLEKVWKRNPRAIVRFSYPAERRPLRELEQRQARVETQIRLDERMSLEHQRVMDDLANQRERRIRPTLSDLHERLRAKMK